VRERSSPDGNAQKAFVGQFKLGLDFDIIAHETIEVSRGGSPFAEKNLTICRLDQLSRNDDVQARLEQTDWDLVVVDEAHKMSAHFYGTEIEETKRYKLGRMLGSLTRHLLLMMATPHSGKQEDFQLFMVLLDPDRFEGKPRKGGKQLDAHGLMRRMMKEELLTFEGKPLFPERRACTVTYTLSPEEAQLYHDVTEYVREEMNRAERLRHKGDGRRGNVVGFALTVLQRRLESSPEAIYQSLRRRRERLETRLNEERLGKRSAAAVDLTRGFEAPEDVDDLRKANGRSSRSASSIRLPPPKRSQSSNTRSRRSAADGGLPRDGFRASLRARAAAPLALSRGGAASQFARTSCEGSRTRRGRSSGCCKARIGASC
jgi:hypothetical protein